MILIAKCTTNYYFLPDNAVYFTLQEKLIILDYLLTKEHEYICFEPMVLL